PSNGLRNVFPQAEGGPQVLLSDTRALVHQRVDKGNPHHLGLGTVHDGSDQTSLSLGQFLIFFFPQLLSVTVSLYLTQGLGKPIGISDRLNSGAKQFSGYSGGIRDNL